MQMIPYWTQFEHTGKIEDYLSYVSAQEKAAENTENGKESGRDPYAGVTSCDRNGIKADGCGGI